MKIKKKNILIIIFIYYLIDFYNFDPYVDKKLLSIYKSPFTKIRLGKEYNEGYVIADITTIKYNILISAGIKDDISFEENFMNKYNSKVIVYDGTINKLPKVSNITFINKNIGEENDLHDLIYNNRNIFIKMDIEGYEDTWLLNLSDYYLKKVDQIVIEFHRYNIDSLNKLNKYFILIHLHGNNCGDTVLRNGKIEHKVIELTYLNKRYFTNTPIIDLEKSELDMPNCI